MFLWTRAEGSAERLVAAARGAQSHCRNAHEEDEVAVEYAGGDPTCTAALAGAVEIASAKTVAHRVVIALIFFSSRGTACGPPSRVHAENVR